MTDAASPTVAPRLGLVDAARGAAILGVIAYHFCWDLRFFEFAHIPIDTSPVWFAFARSLLGSFMFLTGVGLALAHRHAINWSRFWRRFAVLLGAAMAVTLVTYFVFREAFVYFGVLHAIALFALMTLPFLFRPLWLAALVAVPSIFAPAFFTHPAFNERILSWLGFWQVPPYTEDLVPVFPWVGVVLAGMIAARLWQRSGKPRWLSQWQARDPVSRLLVFAGRKSLLIYLLHQLALFAILFPLAQFLHPEQARRVEEFGAACQASCQISGEAGYCQRYCACASEQIETGDLWPLALQDPPTPEQTDALRPITRLCTVMAQD